MPNSPVNVYLAYAPADRDLLKQLRVQLSAIERIGLVDAWHDAEVETGTDREVSMMKALNESPIILLLVSADFFASEFAYEREMKTALALHEQGKAKVIPVILRACTWKYTPLAKLDVLPENEIPVTNEHWRSPDEAFSEIVEAVVGAVKELQQPGSTSTPVSELGKPVAIATEVKNTEDVAVFPSIEINGLNWMTRNLQTIALDGTTVDSPAGKFYDFKAALKACPKGWRLPTKKEWKALNESQVEELRLAVNGLYDRGFARDQGRKAYYWSSDRSYGGEAWCFERTTKSVGRVESRYVHWAMNCRCVRAK